MSRPVLYVSHPVEPTEDETREAASVVPCDATDGERRHALRRPVRANLDSAMRWLSWLRKSFPETTFIAPWIANIMAGEDDLDPKQHEAGLLDACAVIERCDGIVLVGRRISSGMRREMEHGVADHAYRSSHVAPLLVYDLTSMGKEPDMAFSMPPVTIGEFCSGWLPW